MKATRKNLKNAKSYRIKPIHIRAIQINEDFELSYGKFIFKARAGDYLIENIDGSLSTCDKFIFEQLYEEIG